MKTQTYKFIKAMEVEQPNNVILQPERKIVLKCSGWDSASRIAAGFQNKAPGGQYYGCYTEKELADMGL